MRNTTSIYIALSLAAAAIITTAAYSRAADALTLHEAVGLTLDRNPKLLASHHEVNSLDGALSQAGALPNPVLFGEMEEFGGTGELSGTGSAAYKIGISQEFMLGGKRANGVKSAGLEKELGLLRKAALAREMVMETEKRFINAYSRRECLVLERESLELMQRFSHAATRRVELGEAPALELTRARAELSIAMLRVGRAENELDNSMRTLVLMWGGDAAEFSGIDADFSGMPDVPPDQELEASLHGNPEYLAFEKEVEISEAQYRVAKSGTWPDIEIGGGVQVLNETGDQAFFVEFSVPIPVLDAKSGEIRAVGERVGMAEGRRAAGQQELRNRLAMTAGTLRTVAAEYDVMLKDVEPAARETYDAVGKAYMIGEQSYLELSFARTAYNDARRDLVRLKEEMLLLDAELRWLTSGAAVEPLAVHAD